MSWHALSFALCLTCATAAADVRDWLDREVPQRLQQADIPAAIVAVVHGNETVIAGFGAAAETAVFRVGSVSKPVTASILLALVAAGELDLQTDLRPTMAALNVTPALQQPLTLHHLLTHSAGFNERLFGQHTGAASTFLSMDDYLRAHLPPRFIDPGQVIAYNDHHTALAGWVAEQISGERFEQLAQRHLFIPLGMTSSSFAQVDLPPDMAGRIVQARTGIGGTGYPRDYIQLPPAAGLYTTAPDMAAYMRALLGAALPGTAAQLSVQFRPHPAMPGRAYGFAEGRHGPQMYLFKDGQASGFNARLLLVPDQSFGLFVAHNRNIFGPFGAIEPAGRFNRQLGADLLAELWPLAELDPGHTNLPPTVDIDTAPFSGTYRTVIAARHTWERLASLFDEAVIQAQIDGLHLGSQRYIPREATLFESAAQPGHHIAFRRDGDRVSHLFVGGGAYERVPWATSQAALPWIVGLPLVLLLITGLRLAPIDTWRVFIVNGALLVFFVGLGMLFWLVDLQRFFRGPPLILLGLLALPLLALPGALLQLARLRHSRPLARFSSLVAAAIVLGWLWYWNLLGYWLG